MFVLLGVHDELADAGGERFFGLLLHFGDFYLLVEVHASTLLV